MSILQEHEQIRKRIGEERYSHIEAFLAVNKKYSLCDVYYKESVWEEFEVWEKNEYNNYIAPVDENGDFPDNL